MSLVYMIDEGVLDYIESICHAVQKVIGMTNFDIARYAALLGVICDVVYYLFVLTPRSPFSLLISLGFFTYLLYGISCSEKSAEISIKSGYMNSQRLIWRGARVLCMVLFVFESISDIVQFLSTGATAGVWTTVHVLCTSLVFYLLSCTPLPPAPSRLSKFFSKFKLTPLSEVQPSES